MFFFLRRVDLYQDRRPKCLSQVCKGLNSIALKNNNFELIRPRPLAKSDTVPQRTSYIFVLELCACCWLETIVSVLTVQTSIHQPHTRVSLIAERIYTFWFHKMESYSSQAPYCTARAARGFQIVTICVLTLRSIISSWACCCWFLLGHESCSPTLPKSKERKKNRRTFLASLQFKSSPSPHGTCSFFCFHCWTRFECPK